MPAQDTTHMRFEHDVFLSYAHLDDAALIEGRKGWVANLHRALELRVGMFLGKSPQIWRDPKLQGNDVFEETLIELLKNVAVLVSVVSPRYVRSEWTRRELAEFAKAAERQVGLRLQNKARFFKVLKTPVPLEQQAPELQSLLGYEFFKVDPESGRVQEFNGVFGAEAEQDFWKTLDDLAQDLCDTLEIFEAPEPPPEQPDEDVKPGPAPGDLRLTVFLAETTGDLKEQRNTIRRDLQQHGYTVLPAAPLPFDAAEVDAGLRADLAKCSMSIHLIGQRYSLTPEGGVASLVEIQNERAIERGERGDFTRLVWIPPGLQPTDPRQQQVIDRLRSDPRMGQRADLLEIPLEDLRTVVQTTLERARSPKPLTPPSTGPAVAAPAGTASVYLVYDERDATAVLPWANFLFEQGAEVLHPAFQGDEGEVREYHEETLRTSDAVVLFFGSANELWLRRKFRELQKVAGYGRTKPVPAVAVCLLAPKTPEKERFRTHEAIVLPQWDGPEPGPWAPIIARLKG
jgi:hypothetical protein